jgi:transcriptional regulator with GAF, ATPase, and Fis domain
MAEASQGLAQSLSLLLQLLEVPLEAFEAVAKLAVKAVPGCDGASFSVLEADGQVTTVAASDERTARLDELQYLAREGPCLSAIHTATIVQVDDFADESRYPVFSRAATGEAVASCLSIPLAASGRTIGGLNLYGEASSAYDHKSVAAATELAAQGALLLSITKAHHASAALVDQLQAAMTRRAVIEQARGILMARTGCSAEQAFDMLRGDSQRQNANLHDIAHAVVASLAEAAE